MNIIYCTGEQYIEAQSHVPTFSILIPGKPEIATRFYKNKITLYLTKCPLNFFHDHF